MQQWPILVFAGALQDLIDAGTQIDDRAALFQHATGFFAQDGATTGSEYDIFECTEFADYLCLALAEAFFTLDFENDGNGGASTRFNFVI